MEHRQPDDPAYPRDLFAGASSYYVRHRPPYPPAMIERLLLASGLRRRRRALDLCCGTGHAAIVLSPHFESVLAVDQEAEMVAAGREVAARSGLSNIGWVVARAEELAITPGSLDLIAIANAFHRVHRVAVARRAARWLRPGGVFVDMGYSTVVTGTEPWHAAVSSVIGRWRRAGDAPVLGGAWRTCEEVLTEAGLVMLDDEEIRVPRRWTLDELVGYAFSTSGASPEIMGAAAGDFEADLRRSLLDLDPSGTYEERICYYFRIARRAR